MAPAALRQLKKLLPDRHPLRLLWHRVKAFFAALRCGFPAHRLTVIGITGTDGKTTTVGMVAHILQECGVPAGALSTAFFRVKGDVTWNATQKTSPSPAVIQSFLKKLTVSGCTHAVLECSSHGLTQGRVAWTWPAIAAITNTSPEHLDYHGTMERYRADKGRLFRMLRTNGTKVLNADDATYSLYRPLQGRTVSYSAKADVKDSGDLRLWMTDMRADTSGVSATLHRGGDTLTRRLELPVAGAFNLENALCALGCALGAGIDLDRAVTSLKSFHGVPGRIERIDAGQPFSVFVDFTVTPASYKRTLTTLRDSLSAGKRLFVLTGSCGDRMREKRPEVGKICGEIADVVVVSNEDPYTENPDTIIDEVYAGLAGTRAETHRIPDRMEAIKFLFLRAKPGDAVILCGKGSDTTMWVKTGQIPWNERQIARDLLVAMSAMSVSSPRA